MLAIVASLSVFVPAAVAADLGGSLSNVTAVVTGPATVSQTDTSAFELDYDACLPETTAAGDSWRVTLPTEITNWPPSFSIANPEDSTQTWITVTINNGVATYTLTAAGAAQQSLCFRSDFGGTLAPNQTPGDHTLTVTTQGGATITAGSVTITAGTTGEQTPPTTNTKGISFATNDQCRTTTTDCLNGWFSLAGGDQGVVTITDQSQPNWTFDCPSFTFRKLTYTDGNVSEATGDPSLLTVTCSPTSVTVTVNTTGSPANVNYEVAFDMTAVTPGLTGLVTYTNTAEFEVAGQTEPASGTIESSYAGGSASGAHLSLVKRDAAGNHAPAPGDAVPLPTGSTGLVFSIVNNGTQVLTDVNVSDAVTSGSGVISDLSCAFPGGSTGTSWPGPFAVGASFQCTAQLSGVLGPHEDSATVTAEGESNEPVTSTDTYNAVTPFAPDIATQIASATALVGGTLSDTVTVSSTGGGAITGAWTLLGPVAAVGGACTTVDWTGAASFDSGTFAVSGDGSYVTASTKALATAGCYTFVDSLPATATTEAASTLPGATNEVALVSEPATTPTATPSTTPAPSTAPAPSTTPASAVASASNLAVDTGRAPNDHGPNWLGLVGGIGLAFAGAVGLTVLGRRRRGARQ